MGETGAESANRQSWSNQQILMGVLAVALVVAVGLGLYFGLHKSGHHKKTGTSGKPLATRIGPTPFTAQELKVEAKSINTKFFWAGRQQKGETYEFTRATTGYLYVRYLPPGVTSAPVNSDNYLVISSYPFPNGDGYTQLKKSSGGVEGFGGSYVWQRPDKPTNVLVAWPDKPTWQVEVYSPIPDRALVVAQSKNLKQVFK